MLVGSDSLAVWRFLSLSPIDDSRRPQLRHRAPEQMKEHVRVLELRTVRLW